MRPHQKLEAWIKGVAFVTDVYRETGEFPKDERFGLTSQIRRAAISIPANLAEGAGAIRAKNSRTLSRTPKVRPVSLRPS